MSKPSEVFVIRLKSAMDARGLTQQALSDLTGINRTQLAKYAKGRTTPGVDNLAEIAVALGVTTDSLLGLSPPPPLTPEPREPTKEEMAMFVMAGLKLDQDRREAIKTLLVADQKTFERIQACIDRGRLQEAQ